MINKYNIQNQKPLLLKLANQAVNHYRKKAEDEENLAMIIEHNIHEIAEDIYKQISKKVELKSPSYLATEIGKPKPSLDWVCNPVHMFIYLFEFGLNVRTGLQIPSCDGL